MSGQDDFAAMEEVIRRRLSAYLAERELPVEQRGRFAYPPSLIVVDGGAGQLGRAVAVLGRAGIWTYRRSVSRSDSRRCTCPDREEPIQIPKGRESLYLLQRVRDEAHRFAITYHRNVRGKKMIDSVLDDVPGIGPARKKALIRRFGSLKQIRAASKEELAEVVPDSVAATLWESLHG